MSNDKTPNPKAKKSVLREQRLKAALKSNLQRRKSQGAARGKKNENEKAG
ncbi:hypothetical protein N9C96_01845 [bacterium]|nr:hypothetical protein [bacterium]